MNFTITTKPLPKIATDLLVVFTTEDKLLTEEKLADRLLAGRVSALRQSKDFSGEANKTRLIFATGSTPRVLLVGLGKQADLTLEKIREAAALATTDLKRLPVKHVTFLLPSFAQHSPQTLAQAITETILLANYEFPYYKVLDKDRAKLENLELIAAPRDAARAKAGCATGQILAQAVIAGRDLGNHPSNVATPTHLAEHAQKIAKSSKRLTVKILHRAEIAKEQMGALLAVAKGSDEEPKFIVLEYTGRKAGKPVVLVGKGITFDSGGISIKPAEKMEEMKYDMAGAATVMGVIKAAADLNLPVHLVGLIPATENLPSGKASKPGDIIRSRSGKTIEIVNTDAEGRLILADALDYAKKYKPALVLDFATLTGAIVAALGDDLIGAFTNQEGLVNRLQAAAVATGEKVWPMPLEKSYEEFIKSDFADLRNIGTVKFADAINAANFLKEFVDYPWIHLDIAGVAWATREKPYRPKGATGTGVRLAIEFLKNLKKLSS